jgi:hypothetical protein
VPKTRSLLASRTHSIPFGTSISVDTRGLLAELALDPKEPRLTFLSEAIPLPGIKVGSGPARRCWAPGMRSPHEPKECMTQVTMGNVPRCVMPRYRGAYAFPAVDGSRRWPIAVGLAVTRRSARTQQRGRYLRLWLLALSVCQQALL